MIVDEPPLAAVEGAKFVLATGAGINGLLVIVSVAECGDPVGAFELVMGPVLFTAVPAIVPTTAMTIEQL
jgi:hypothetical protein